MKCCVSIKLPPLFYPESYGKQVWHFVFNEGSEADRALQPTVNQQNDAYQHTGVMIQYIPILLARRYTLVYWPLYLMFTQKIQYFEVEGSNG